MKIQNIPYSVIDWSEVEITNHKGETGTATWRTVQKGDIRVRIVEYSENYLADHWCAKGHVIYILEGEMVSELKDGTKSLLKAGMSYIVEDDDKNPHRTYTKNGVKLLIVD
jgi:hypothetical protein